ncbi:MAG: ISKra4 family transposase, partial [Desulfomicrobium sp.]|nr:ISKra4 family transposase [Desulfomicrobium sp.]
DANQKLKRLSVLISNLRSYLVQNTTSIVDYCHRYWSGQPISSSPAESAANSLVNARMNKKRQMRWSPAGAHRVLQVRAAVADGRLKQAKFALAA